MQITEAPTTTATTSTTSRDEAPARPTTTVHRLRDLDRRGRWVAAAFAVALLIAPAMALAQYAADWIPSGDPALMGLRSLDVGTENSPLMGQPSMSGLYVEDNMVRHLGPSHFYLMAPFVRLLGAPLGMLFVSVSIVGASVLVATWAVFRQLGPGAAALAATGFAAVTFTTGASSLVNPVGSNIAGYPFLCSIILLWCLMCGDVRLLPLTVGVVSFTAQQHLSVLPVLGIATVAGALGLASSLRRGDGARPGDRTRPTFRWLALSTGIAAVLWAPILVQQAVGTAPNLSRLVTFTLDDERPTLGYTTALRQVTHAVGLPPLLGRSDMSGTRLFAPVSPFTWLTAGLVVAALVVCGLRWRHQAPQRFALVVMTFVIGLAGLFSGASVPRGYEQYRLVFYHWALVLMVLVALVLGLAVSEIAGRSSPSRDPARNRATQLQPLLTGLGLVAIVALGVVNPTLDRWSNSLAAAFAPVDRASLEELADQIVGQRDQFGDEVLLVARGRTFRSGVHEALALALVEEGLTVEHPRYDGAFVADDRLVDAATVDSALVLQMHTGVRDPRAGPQPPGSIIASVELDGDFDPNAFGERIPVENRPRRLEVYLLDRDHLLDWTTLHELDS